MYEAFQRPIDRAPTSFTVGDLSVFVADTRMDRTEGTDAFATDAQLSAIETWIHGLSGPGCLVVGQLVFSGRAGWKGRWMDYGLADFGSYRRLAEALLSAQHIRCDPHRRRAFRPGRGLVPRSGGDIVEVVASPLALVAPVPKNTWKPAPSTFPEWAIPGLTRRPVQTAEAFQLNANQFSTVAFSRSGGFVRMRVRAWPVETAGRVPVATNEFEYWIS